METRKIYLEENEFINLSNKEYTVIKIIKKGKDDWLSDVGGIVILLKMKGVYMNLYKLFLIEIYQMIQDGVYNVCLRKIVEPTVDHSYIMENCA